MDLRKWIPDPFRAWKEKRKKWEQNQFGKVGLSEIEFLGENRADTRELFWTNGILNFLVVFGCIGTILQGFSVPWSAWFVAPILLFMALFLSLFYKDNRIRLGGYFVLVPTIILGLQQYLPYFRTGFAVIANHMMLVVEKELALPMEREYELYVKNELLAVNLCLILIGTVLMMLFNIIITEMKNYLIVLFFSFPFLQLPIYLNCEIPVFYFAMYIAGVLTMYCLRINGHYGVQGKKKDSMHRQRILDEIYDFYNGDGKSSLFVVGAALLVVFAVMLPIRLTYSPIRFENAHAYDSKWKENTRNFAKRFALVGFWGMLSSEGEGVGGVGTGKLGTLDRVRLDFEPDFLFYTSDTVNVKRFYLRGFSAKYYTGNEWVLELDTGNNDTCVHYQPADDFVLLDYLEAGLFRSEYHKYVLQNVGATSNYAHIPYWNGTGAVNRYNGRRGEEEKIAFGYSRDRMFFPETQIYTISELKQLVEQVQREQTSENWSTYRQSEERYRTYAYQNYLEVPETLGEKITELCREQGIDAAAADVVERVQDYLRENYTYTLMPGVTPKDEDFVEYFLFEQKKGYCVYFASAATLIYRTLGIPARYVCGYAVDEYQLREAEEIDVSEVEGAEGFEGTIRCVEITDADAHAWVEIYVDGFGWYPVEVTTSSSEPEETTQESRFETIQGFVTNLFRAETVEKVRGTINLVAVRICVAAAAMIAGLLLFGAFVRRRRTKRFQTEQTNETVCEMYRYLRRLIETSKVKTVSAKAPQEYGKQMTEAFLLEPSEAKRYIALYEKARFSSHVLTPEEYRFMEQTTAEYAARIRTGMGKWRRFKATVFYFL